MPAFVDSPHAPFDDLPTGKVVEPVKAVSKDETNPKRGRPRKDRSALIGQVFPGSYLQIDGEPTLNKDGRSVVPTTCVAWNPETGFRCGKPTMKRLDNVFSGNTKSCGCRELEIYTGWCQAQALTLSDETCSRIWDLAQVVTRRALQAAWPRLRGGTLTRVISQRQELMDRALADFGEAIRTRMETLRCCETTGKEFKLSGTAVRWILQAVEKQRSLAVVEQTRKQERDADYLDRKSTHLNSSH